MCSSLLCFCCCNYSVVSKPKLIWFQRFLKKEKTVILVLVIALVLLPWAVLGFQVKMAVAE